jgi:hypothetical protein
MDPPEPTEHLHRVGLVIGRVVEDLLAADGPDPGAQPGGDDGKGVIAPAGVDAADEQRGAALLGGPSEALDPLRRCRAGVVERVQRRGDHVLARAQAPQDVVDGFLGTDVPRGHVGNGIAAGKGSVDIGGGRDARRFVEPRECRGILSGFVRR